MHSWKSPQLNTSHAALQRRSPTGGIMAQIFWKWNIYEKKLFVMLNSYDNLFIDSLENIWNI